MRVRRGDFADLMIWLSSRNAGCRSLATFDQGMAALPGVELLGR